MQRCLRIPRTLHILPKVAKCPPTPIPMAGLDPGTNTFQTLYDNDNKVSQFGYEKPENINYFQEQVVEYLIEEYTFVFLPRFRISSFWNHERFYDIMNTSHSGCIDIDEYLTSQICSSCGKRNKCGKIYRCQCGNIMDRDSNAAKNILQRGTLKVANVLPLHADNQSEELDSDPFSY